MWRASPGALLFCSSQPVSVHGSYSQGIQSPKHQKMQAEAHVLACRPVGVCLACIVCMFIQVLCSAMLPLLPLAAMHRLISFPARVPTAITTISRALSVSLHLSIS